MRTTSVGNRLRKRSISCSVAFPRGPRRSVPQSFYRTVMINKCGVNFTVPAGKLWKTLSPATYSDINTSASVRGQFLHCQVEIIRLRQHCIFQNRLIGDEGVFS